jgi:hypothetical protein
LSHLEGGEWPWWKAAPASHGVTKRVPA